MATTIKLKNGSGAPLAGDLVQGEPALDLTNKRLYTEDSGGTIIEVGTNPTSLTTGTFTSTGIDDNATSTAITIDSSENVGIGTASPARALQVEGFGHFGTATAGVTIGENSGVASVFGLNASGTTYKPLEIRTGASGTGFYQDTSGNVGIGTSSPVGVSGYGALTLNGSTGGLIELTDNDVRVGRIIAATATMNIAAEGELSFRTSGIAASDEAMRINSSGNVGIGTTSPASLLDIQGAGAAATSPSVTATTGTNYIGWKSVNTGGSFWTAIDNSTGSAFGTNTSYARVLWSNGAYPMVFSTNSTERMRIDSSGNVGIGTTSPARNLTIGGSSASLSTLQITNATTGTASTDGFQIQQYTSGAVLLWNYENNYTAFGTNNTERMRIDSSGNVGMGTNTAVTYINTVSGSAKGLVIESAVPVLALKDTSAADDVGYIYQSTNDMRIANYAGGNITFNNGSSFTERMRIDSSGNVSIGTTTANTALTVNANPPSATYGVANFTAPAGNDAYIVINRGSADNGGIKVQRGGSIDGAFYVTGGEAVAIGYNMSDTGDSLVFRNGSSNAEVARMDSSGNLLVGTTAFNSDAESLAVDSFAVSQAEGRVLIHSSNQPLELARTSGDNTSRHQVQFFREGGQVGTIACDNTSTTYNTTSDQRLKENIVDAPAGNIDAIRVRSFDWKADGSHQTYGMVAQELVEVAPEAVTQGETDDDMWQVDYSKLVPMMIKEIQDLKAEVAALKGA